MPDQNSFQEFEHAPKCLKIVVAYEFKVIQIEVLDGPSVKHKSNRYRLLNDKIACPAIDLIFVRFQKII